MKWIKKGQIIDPNSKKFKNVYPWSKSHAALPVCFLKNKECLRIYFSTRDIEGRSRIIYVDTNPSNPKEVLSYCDKSILELGDIGTFDDNGMMPSSVIEKDGLIYMYYIGWNIQVTTSYRLSIGLAISHDRGDTFKKFSEGPILDRDHKHPYFNTAPNVLKFKDEYLMYYVSCVKWEIINDWPEPYYDVKLAKSKDGIQWERQSGSCIELDEFTHAIGKPFVIVDGELLKMFYSYRHSDGYRNNKENSYRIGYAESENGLVWKRKDEQIGITFSKEGWDSVMMEYCSLFSFDNQLTMIYNGNGFGETGFGFATLESKQL